MTVRIQSGTTVFVNSGQTVQTPQAQNAGTITNAGTTQQFRSNVASGSGSGVGTAKSFPPTTRASGIGEMFGTAIDTRVKTVSAGDPPPDIQVNRLSTREIENDETVRAIEIRNAGTITNAGTTQVSQLPVGLTIGLVINSSSTREIERDEISQAVKIRNAGTITNAGTTRVSQAPPREGIGEGVGTARTSPIPFPRAAGLGEGFGTTTAQPDTDSVASGIGEMFGQATTSRLTDRQASGIGEGFGQANPLTLFDPIQHMVGILNDISASELSLPKPERIDPIWEYSHNDRINFPKPALYVYAPTEATVDKFSIDADTTNQTNTIEILIMTLDQERTRAYQQDFVRYLTQFYDDNQTETGFHRFQNITASDIRNEHITQQTDHYIASVTVEVQKFTDI